MIFCIECIVFILFYSLISFSIDCIVSYIEYFILYLKNKIIGRNSIVII